jgi:hypothetical protein
MSRHIESPSTNALCLATGCGVLGTLAQGANCGGRAVNPPQKVTTFHSYSRGKVTMSASQQ